MPPKRKQETSEEKPRKRGELLWGQIQTLLEGSTSKSHDSTAGPIERPPGGTILMHDFQYRLAARVGTWKVSRIFLKGDHIGYVVYHSDVSPIEFVRRAADVGISNRNDHDDKEIVYVNRYDWSWHHGDSSVVLETFLNSSKRPRENDDDESENNDDDDDDDDDDFVDDDEQEEDEEGLISLMGGRIFCLDAEQFPVFVKHAKESKQFYKKIDEYNVGFRLPGRDENIGIHGWIGFSGKKHDIFKDSDEAVAFVYDGAYSALCSDSNSKSHLMVESQPVYPPT